MTTRYRIKRVFDGTEIMDLGASEPFQLEDTKYPGNWISSGGDLPVEYTIEPYTVPPPAPPTRWQIDYVTFLDRLSDADADLVATFIEGKPAKVRERLRYRGIWSDDTQVRAWLTGRSYDPDVVLAR